MGRFKIICNCCVSVRSNSKRRRKKVKSKMIERIPLSLQNRKRKAPSLTSNSTSRTREVKTRM